MDMPAYEVLFKRIKYNFWLSGIAFDEPKLSLRFYVLVIIYILVLIEESAYMILKASQNILELTHVVACTLNGLLALLKILPIAAKKQKLFQLNDSLKRLYVEMMTDNRKRKIVRHNVILVHFLMNCFLVLNIVVISIYNFTPLLLMGYYYWNKKEVSFLLPFNVTVPFSIDSWVSWFPVYIHVASTGFICVLYYTAVDCLYCVLTSQICNHFAVITDEISNLDSKNTDVLKQIVKNHQYILKLSEDLEDIFKLPNLFKVVVGSLEICSLGFNLTMSGWNQTPASYLFLFSVLLQILMMSIFGENLIRESLRVGEAAYTCNWYEMNQAAKKIILTIMIRSSKPSQLTAYKFSTISYQSFTKIISTSWSYFTLLKTVYNGPES